MEENQDLDALKRAVNMARAKLGMDQREFHRIRYNALETIWHRLQRLENEFTCYPRGVASMKPSEVAKMFSLDRHDVDAFEKNVVDKWRQENEKD